MVLAAASTFSVRLLRELAVIAEGVKGGRRNGVNRVGADQFFDVEHVAILRVLGAGAGPQQPLRLRALCRKRLPARSAE